MQIEQLYNSLEKLEKEKTEFEMLFSSYSLELKRRITQNHFTDNTERIKTTLEEISKHISKLEEQINTLKILLTESKTFQSNTNLEMSNQTEAENMRTFFEKPLYPDDEPTIGGR